MGHSEKFHCKGASETDVNANGMLLLDDFTTIVSCFDKKKSLSDI